MRQTMLAFLGMMTVAAVSPASAFAQTWIEYTVTGAVSLEGRDEDVLICSESSDGFQLAARGEWYIDIEADGKGPGQHAVRFTVAAPDSIAALRDDDFRTDDRFRGDGTITIEAAGKGQLGLALVKIAFSGTDLESGAGHTINVEGNLLCAVM